MFQYFFPINLIGGAKMRSWLKVRKVSFRPKGCWHFVLAGTFVLVTVIGCAQTREAERSEMIPTPAATYRFEDVPIPRSVAIEKKESFIYESEAIKTGILVYVGKAKVGELANFFKGNMVNHGWKLVSNFQRDDALLNFNKPGWSCVISILPISLDRAKVEVRVGPTESQ
jgi:hypothetical protein